MADWRNRYSGAALIFPARGTADGPRAVGQTHGGSRNVEFRSPSSLEASFASLLSGRPRKGGFLIDVSMANVKQVDQPAVRRADLKWS